MKASRLITLSGRRASASFVILTMLLIVFPAFPASDPVSQAVPVAAAVAKVSQELQGVVSDVLVSVNANAMVPVIVRTSASPSPSALQRLQSKGGLLKSSYTALRGYAATVPASQIDSLADDADVEHISYDSPVKSKLDIAYPAVKADLAFANSGGLDGRGVGIAIIDSGVVAHPDLLRPPFAPQVVEIEIVNHEPGLMDYYGHGTHVAGILNGSGLSSSGPYAFRTFRGIAPGARLISIRALAADGTGFTSDIIAGIERAVQNKSAYNIRVLNLSLGHPVYESYQDDPLCRAVEYAVNQGIVVVVAAGNDGGFGSGFGTITSPGNDPRVITVGAMDDSNTVTTTDDVVAWYSSKGPSLVDYVAKPDLVAPGTSIVSLRAPSSYIDVNYHPLVLKIQDYRKDRLFGGLDGAYLSLSGTSMAAPFVAGTAALMIQKEPGLNPATVKARLMQSAVKDDRLIFETGAGYLDVDAALKATGFASSALSPTVMLGPDNQVYVEDTAQTWGAAWSETAIWGGAKGRAAGLCLTDVPAAITSAYTAIWGGRVGAHAMVENDQVTRSGAIWTGERSCVSPAGSAVNSETAIWGRH